jgi:molybdopterin-containing oxidoreductase family iron-sulfur binding subunit
MVQTACQQVCPTQAIVFGNINDANAVVTKLQKEPLAYGSLDKLNVRPRVKYLAKLKNPNPTLAEAKEA